MAAHHVSLAKASFAASLFRPDVTKVSRDDLTHFHTTLELVIEQCSPRNIQNCKQWLVDHVVLSATRKNALGKFLATLSRHLNTQAPKPAAKSLSRQRLHILYLLNDLLHHARFHVLGPTTEAAASRSLDPFLLEIFQHCAADGKKRVLARLHNLVEIWQTERLFSDTYISQLKASLSGELVAEPSASNSLSTSEKNISELPYLIPATHGDPSLPFHDLPAANLMPLIVPNSSQSIRPQDVKPLQFSAGPADEGLINALQDFLADIDGVGGSFTKSKDESLLHEVDELGQSIGQNEAGDLVGDTYYGWSLAFCQRMKARDKDKPKGSSRRSLSISSTRSRGRNPHKRRRYSGSDSERSRFSRSSSSDRSDSRSRGPSGRRNFRTQDKGRSRSRTYSPKNSPPRVQNHIATDPAFNGNSGLSFPNQIHPGLPFPPPLIHPGGFPIPPPPPPNWRGEWPPAPPGVHLPPPPPPQLSTLSFPHQSHPYQPRYDGNRGGSG